MLAGSAGGRDTGALWHEIARARQGGQAEVSELSLGAGLLEGNRQEGLAVKWTNALYHTLKRRLCIESQKMLHRPILSPLHMPEHHRLFCSNGGAVREETRF